MGKADREAVGHIKMAGVDWLTATTQRLVGRDEYRKLAYSVAKSLQAGGNQDKQWLWQGYVGFQISGLTWGERPDSSIMRLSGSLAASYWRDAVRWCDNVSRIDLQTTVHYKPFPRHLGTDGYRQILNANEGDEDGPNAQLRISTDGGETLYLGKGSSDKYARLYNKASESKEAEYTDCWRYEVEVKNKPAKRIALELLAMGDERPYITTYVWRHFADRNVAPTFSPSLGDGLVSVPRSRSNDEKRLTWLEFQVYPVVAGLIDRGRLVAIREIFKL